MMNTSSRITSDQGVVLMQYLARALFAGLAVMYFHHADHFFFTLPKATPWLLFCAYIGIQLLLLIWRPVNADAFASALDLLTLGIVLLLDAPLAPALLRLFSHPVQSLQLLVHFSLNGHLRLRTHARRPDSRQCVNAMRLMRHVRAHRIMLPDEDSWCKLARRGVTMS